jgi:hypothetical protein
VECHEVDEGRMLRTKGIEEEWKGSGRGDVNVHKPFGTKSMMRRLSTRYVEQ